MIALSAAEIASAAGGNLTPALAPDIRARGPVTTDSREVVPGAIFVALRGEKVDGHDYISAALAAGAVFVITQQETTEPAIIVADAQHALGRLAHLVLQRLTQVTTVAVTGSVGKTTTKDLLAQLLAPLGDTVAPRGSFNNEVGMPLTVLSANESTRYLVLEMGASGIGHLDYLTDIARPDVSVVLAVGRAHLGGFGGIEAVAAAKSELVTGTATTGTVILNSDDHRVAAMAEVAGERPVITFGSSGNVQARDITVTEQGKAEFTLHYQGQSAAVELQLIGEHQIANALAAASVALHLGRSVSAVAHDLSAAQPLSYGRMRLTQRADGVRVINDAYNANPDSMAAAVRALARIGSEQRTWAVLGEMLELGPDHDSAHAEVGRFTAAAGIENLIVVGSGAQPIAAGALSAGMLDSRVSVVADVEQASMVLQQELRPGDAVLVKASNGSGLWRLGDMLLDNQEED